jgi:hypothetical protein
VVQFAIGAAFQVIAALQFKRDVVGPALRAFYKPVIERGHGSRGIYTKRGEAGVIRDSGESHLNHSELSQVVIPRSEATRNLLSARPVETDSSLRSE